MILERSRIIWESFIKREMLIKQVIGSITLYLLLITPEGRSGFFPANSFCIDYGNELKDLNGIV